jgi:hypothetical protein
MIKQAVLQEDTTISNMYSCKQGTNYMTQKHTELNIKVEQHYLEISMPKCQALIDEDRMSAMI